MQPLPKRIQAGPRPTANLKPLNAVPLSPPQPNPFPTSHLLTLPCWACHSCQVVVPVGSLAGLRGVSWALMHRPPHLQVCLSVSILQPFSLHSPLAAIQRHSLSEMGHGRLGNWGRGARQERERRALILIRESPHLPEQVAAVGPT